MSEPTALEKAWREYMARCGYPNGDAPLMFEAARANFAAGFAAGATASDIKKLILTIDPLSLQQIDTMSKS